MPAARGHAPVCGGGAALRACTGRQSPPEGALDPSHPEAAASAAPLDASRPGAAATAAPIDPSRPEAAATAAPIDPVADIAASIAAADGAASGAAADGTCVRFTLVPGPSVWPPPPSAIASSAAKAAETAVNLFAVTDHWEVQVGPVRIVKARAFGGAAKTFSRARPTVYGPPANGC